MNSIYNKTSNEVMITRINSLTPESKPLWGKMTVDQMLRHCTSAANVAFGTQDLKVNFLMRFLGKSMKTKIFNSAFKKNSPTAKEFIFTDSKDFNQSKLELIECVTLFNQGHQIIKVLDHPFWGKMTYEDWDKLIWNHLDHHLKQFGV
jgi:hypothetical protein